ncbi:hypothetical protein VUR80DRAFT_4395 [Thermomyces stellatus]
MLLSVPFLVPCFRLLSKWVCVAGICLSSPTIWLSYICFQCWLEAIYCSRCKFGKPGMPGSSCGIPEQETGPLLQQLL